MRQVSNLGRGGRLSPVLLLALALGLSLSACS